MRTRGETEKQKSRWNRKTEKDGKMRTKQNKNHEGARKVAQWVKSLLGKKEMLSSDPQHPSTLGVTPVMSALGGGEVDLRVSLTSQTNQNSKLQVQ